MTQSMRYVLVTGTNGGLGLGICTRLLDDFLETQPSSSSLTLLFTTRSSRKGTETLQTLRSHLSQHHPLAAQNRIHLQPENVELTNLFSVRALSQKLLASDIPYLNTVILNAGIGGWAGLNWPLCIWDIMTGITSATSWPRFKIGIVGLITEKQMPVATTAVENTVGGSTGGILAEKSREEPPLGQVFCANVFGHYMLVHWLMPLLRACEAANPARVVWVSSIEPRARNFQEGDMMALRAADAYESSKRLTDILVLTAGSKATSGCVSEFMGVQSKGEERVKRQIRSTPAMVVGHPGSCVTSIVALYWIMAQGYLLGMYLARWFGSPWATVSPYLAASVFSWLTFASSDEIDGREAQFGKARGRVKWGAAVSRLGQSSIQPTEVEGWGLNGSGDAFTKTWWAGSYGRAPGARDAVKENIEEFEATGGRVWREMEKLRTEWEARLQESDRLQAIKE